MKATERVPGRMSGALVFKDTRIPVSRVLYLMSRNRGIDEIIQHIYPHLTKENVLDALRDVADILVDYTVEGQ